MDVQSRVSLALLLLLAACGGPPVEPLSTREIDPVELGQRAKIHRMENIAPERVAPPLTRVHEARSDR